VKCTSEASYLVGRVSARRSSCSLGKEMTAGNLVNDGTDKLSAATDVAGLIVGVLELQGDFAEHTAMLRLCGVQAVVSVRQPKDLADNLDALVLPGGESTVIGKLLNDLAMLDGVRKLAAAGLPMFGTCAGCILLAKDLPEYPDQPRIGAMDISVKRNSYGRQIDSFETAVRAVSGIFSNGEPLRVVQIRAPSIERVGDGVVVLAEHAGKPILVRQGNLYGATFHPELTRDSRVHALFLETVRVRKARIVASQ
jgi:pyridoxal 5'-phosphate synthase pdxT subunit